MALIASYAFADVQLTIVGPGGLSISIGGRNSGVHGDGITVTASGQKNIMHEGADGSVLHNLIASRSAKMTISLLRSSVYNSVLQKAYNFQTRSAITHGAMTCSLTNAANTEGHTMLGVAFAKAPEDSYKTEGSPVVWEFDIAELVSERGQQVVAP